MTAATTCTSMTQGTSLKGMQFPSRYSKLVKPIADSTFGEGIECGREALEPRAQRLGVPADANAEVLRHLEEAAGDDGGFILFAEQLEESFWISAMRQAREDNRARRRTHAKKVATGIQEAVEERAVGGEERARAFPQLFQVVESHHGEALGGVRAGGGEEIVEEPDAAGQIGGSKNPAAAQAAEAIHFGETAGDDEGILVDGSDRLAEREAEWRCLAEKHFEINLVNKHACICAMGHLTDGKQHVRGEQRAAGVVQIRKQDEARRWRHGAAQFFEIDGKS